VTISDETTPTRRGKPAGVFGAILLTAVTDTDSGPPPAGVTDGRFAGVATRGKQAVPLPAGSKGKVLWVYGMWINDRGVGGPISEPARTTIAA
jgi:hypothetical protein